MENAPPSIANTALCQILQSQNWQEVPRFDVPLRPYLTAKIGGLARAVLTLSNTAELQQFLAALGTRVPWIVLGRGSNTLFTDAGFEGVILLLKGNFRHIEHNKEQQRIRCYAGATNTKLALYCRKHGLSGAEFLSTIPGCLGGAVCMNAGAHGAELQDLVRSCSWVDSSGRLHTFSPDECRFRYRSSYFLYEKGVLVSADLQLQGGLSSAAIEAREYKLHQQRKSTQPIKSATWGSVFKNPTVHQSARGQSAGELIESCGLKGFVRGGARISPKHANFIENTGGASFEDLRYLMRLAHQSVKDKYNIPLELEVRIYNPDGSRLDILQDKNKYSANITHSLG